MRSLPKRVSQSIRLLGNCLLQRVCISPQALSSSQSIDAKLLPPRDFITATVNFAMVGPAQGNNELIAHLAPEGSGLREPKVMRI